MFNNGKIFRESEEPIVGDKVWMWRESLRWVKCLSVTITSNSVVSLKLSQHLTEEDNRAVRTVRCGQIEAGLISFLLQISANFSVNFQKLAFAKNNLKIFNATICFWSRCCSNFNFIFTIQIRNRLNPVLLGLVIFIMIYDWFLHCVFES